MTKELITLLTIAALSTTACKTFSQENCEDLIGTLTSLAAEISNDVAKDSVAEKVGRYADIIGKARRLGCSLADLPTEAELGTD